MIIGIAMGINGDFANKDHSSVGKEKIRCDGERDISGEPG